jgi:hypothetical protein
MKATGTINDKKIKMKYCVCIRDPGVSEVKGYMLLEWTE